MSNVHDVTRSVESSTKPRQYLFHLANDLFNSTRLAVQSELLSSGVEVLQLL